MTPEQRRDYAHRHYLANMELYKQRAVVSNKQAKIRNRENMLAYLLMHPCADCEERNPVVLDFDHVKGKKEYNVAKMMNSSLSWSKILSEIAKCEVVCANCHRIRTAARAGNWYKSESHSLVMRFSDGTGKVFTDSPPLGEYFTEESEGSNPSSPTQ
jgi:hypothetical protein